MADLALTTLDLLFGMALLFGLGFAAIAFILGEVGGEADFDAELDVDAGADLDLDADGYGDGLSPFSPFIVATFVGGLGGVGLFASAVLGLGPGISTLLALIGGFLFGSIIYLFYGRFLLRSQGSSEARVAAFRGTPATVITAIPDGSVGEIAFAARGSRRTATARSATGEPVPRGTTVMIQEMRGHIAIVRPTSDQPAEPANGSAG